MSRVGVLSHGAKPDARALAPEVARWLLDRHHEVSLVDEDADDFGLPDLATSREGFATLDLLVVMGGDGTMIHGIGLAGLAGVPILGVNLGSLGFLTEVGPRDVYDALERVLGGEHTIDPRSTVEGEVVRATGEVVGLGQGINEISLERGVGGKMIRMTLTIGGQRFTSFGADGIIVATPTGSTAYAFSMRGPVVASELRSLVVVAVGAHALFDRPLVVAPEHGIEVTLHERGRGIVVVDGRPGPEVAGGDVLRCRVGPSTVRLVRLGPDSYFTRVARKFGVPGA